MSSSMKMNGPGMPRAARARNAVEAATMAASQAHAGTARNLLGKLDLGQPPRDCRRFRVVAGDPDLGRRTRDVGENLFLHDRPAGCLLECGRVQVCDAGDGVLTSRESTCRLA